MEFTFLFFLLDWFCLPLQYALRLAANFVRLRFGAEHGVYTGFLKPPLTVRRKARKRDL